MCIRDSLWAEAMLQRLEVPGIKALDIAEEGALHFFIDQETSDGEKTLTETFRCV